MLPIYLKQVSTRLKEERKRLGFKSQELLAVELGIPPRTYWDREKGNVLPDADFLAKINGIGGDVMYIITGSRSPLSSTRATDLRTPAEKAALAIQELQLTTEDSEMLVVLANRLATK